MIRSPWWSRVCATAGVALLFGAAPVQAQTTTLKMQATWPASLTLYENFTFWAERVNKLSAGTLKIDTMPAGQVVPAFEVLDATHKKVLDGAHSWAGYWVGKNKAAILVTGGPGGTFGMDFIDYMGWVYHGGGFELLTEFYQKELKLNVVWIPILPSGPQAFGWFKRPIKNLADFKGMKCRQTGMAAEIWQRMGMQTVNMPGGEIIPSAQRGVIDCAEWVGGVEDLRLGFHNVWKYHYTPGVHENTTVGELLINGDVWKSLSPAAPGDHQVGGERDLPDLVGEVAAPERRRAEGDAGEARRADPAHAARHPDRVPEDLGHHREGGVGEEPVLQEGARLAARVRVDRRAGEAVHVPAVLVRGELLLPREGQRPGQGGTGRGEEIAVRTSRGGSTPA